MMYESFAIPTMVTEEHALDCGFGTTWTPKGAPFIFGSGAPWCDYQLRHNVALRASP